MSEENKNTEESKEIITKNETAITAVKAPRRGFEEGATKDELILPRAKLLQALSPEVQEEGATLKQGVIINSLTKEILPEIFIPIFKFTTWIRFNPRDEKDPNFDPAYDKGEIIWRTNDAADPRTSEAEFGAAGEKPVAIKFMNFLAYFPGCNMPVVLSFAKSSFKAGKRLFSLAKYSTGDMFSRRYKLSKEQKVDGDMRWYEFRVEPAGMVEDKNDFNIAEEWYNDLSKANIVVHMEEDIEEEDREPGAEG